MGTKALSRANGSNLPACGPCLLIPPAQASAWVKAGPAPQEKGSSIGCKYPFLMTETEEDVVTPWCSEWNPAQKGVL